jgi:hypothetical protein
LIVDANFFENPLCARLHPTRFPDYYDLNSTVFVFLGPFFTHYSTFLKITKEETFELGERDLAITGLVHH